MTMPQVVIDNREVRVPQGSTLLDAARLLGIDVPALCWRQGCRPNTACMVCLMKVQDPDRLVPSCATLAEDGMRVASQTEEVREVRRAALDLILSDHAGECRAPCQYACPFNADVPRMLRQIADGRLDDATATAREDIPLLAVLARLGRRGCEGACRRGAVDQPAAIGLLEQHLGDRDNESARPSVPPCEASSGKKVAIVGAGPAGLSAAYFLLLQGHACTLLEAGEAPGGSLRKIAPEQLPLDALAAEITRLERLGAKIELNTPVGRQRTLEDVRGGHDAVLITFGTVNQDGAKQLGLAFADGRLQIDRTTHQTESTGVFAAGSAVRSRSMPDIRQQIVYAAADGKAAATCLDQYLGEAGITGHPKLAALRTGRPNQEELVAMAAEAGAGPAICRGTESVSGLTDEQARAEAQRCLHCDCAKLDGCQLRKYAEMYGADGSRYRGARRKFERVSGHPEIVLEPGKCILCGLCVQIAEQAGEPLGLTFVGRGFDVRIAAPFDESLAKALTVSARQCAEACPTGALALRKEHPCDAARRNSP